MALELLRIPVLVNQELSWERINEIKLTDNYKNILYHINLMHTPLVMREEKKRKFKIIMRSIINEPEILLINKNFRNATIKKINQFISAGIFNEDHEFIALREEINNILISIRL